MAAALNVLAFGVTLALGVALLRRVLARAARRHRVGEFFRADALSAWMVLLISVVSLGERALRRGYFRATWRRER
jgi:formate hydrogenlyase subunit 3/multisubunit Na+/H+ antiporter MnhD subunit